VHHHRLQAAVCNTVGDVGQLACSARGDEVERALHQPLNLAAWMWFKLALWAAKSASSSSTPPAFEM